MKKMICLLVFALLLCAVTVSAAEEQAFSDMPDGAIGEALQNAVQYGILRGYEDNTVRPNQKITRAEMAALIVRTFGATKTADLSAFSDVEEGQWFYEPLSQCVAMGAMVGDGKKLHPEGNITFEEVYTLVGRVFSMEEVDESVLAGYTDAETVAAWARPFAAMLVGNGYWGQDTNVLRPKEQVTRGEFALLLYNIVPVFVDKAGDFENPTGKNFMIRVSGVTVQSPNDCRLIVIGDGVEGNTVILNCKDLPYLVVRGGSVTPAGTVYSVRLAMPSTTLHAGSVKLNHGWGTDDTYVDFGKAD